MPRVTQAQQILDALTDQGTLLFDVATILYGLKIAGPWEAKPDKNAKPDGPTHAQFQWFRYCLDGESVAFIHFEQGTPNHPPRFEWSSVPPVKDGRVTHGPFAAGGYDLTLHETQALADQALENNGWILSP